MDRPDELTRQQLQLIYDNTSDLVFLIEAGDAGYRVASVNRSYLERTQMKPTDIVGRPIEEVLRPEQCDYVKARYDEAVASGGPWRYETRTQMRGATIYLDTTLVPVFNDAGRCTHLIGVSRDITESKRERRELVREKQRAENYLDIAEALIVALDRDGDITMLNGKGYRMLGYPEGSLLGRNWIDVCIAPEKADRFRRLLRDAMTTGTVDRNVNYVRTHSGEQRLISWANAVIRDDDDRIVGLLSSGEDITDRHRAEQALIASQRVLAADEVVSAVAHDFNNSLQGILGNIEIALATEAPAQLRAYLEAAAKLADDAARRLRVLRRSAPAVPDGDAEQIELHDLIDDVIAQTQPLWKDEAQRHGRDLSLRRRLAAALPPVAGNRSELRVMLYNIVKNAVEAIQDDGEIVFETRAEDGFNVVSISDTGRGMDDATSTRIFQPFFSTKGLETGRGLGMSASHGIVRSHGGSIRVARTAPGAGTTIEVRLPVRVDALPGADGAGAAAAGPAHRILWVDDDPNVRALAVSYIRALRQQGDVAGSGEQALALLDRHDYTVVITDIGMPSMNGLELARLIEQRPAAAPPVIALTGWGDTINDGNALPPGIHRVVAKPVRLQTVKEILDALPARPAQNS